MKKAFTMIEFVFVLVAIGILAATIIPSTRTNPLQEAAIQLTSHLRYTQHLAMVDDKYNPLRVDSNGDNIWFKDRWQLVFSSSSYTDNSQAYTIFSDSQGTAVSRGDAQESEVARNPENVNQIMTGGYSDTNALDYKDANFKGMEKLNLGKNYGIISVVLGGGCNSNGSRIAFDYLGRPLQGDHNSMTGPYSASGPQRLITDNCTITLSSATDSIVLTIRPESGYISVLF